MKKHYRYSSRMSKFIFLAISLAAFPFSLAAQAGNVVIGAEISSGGDELATLSSGDSIKAGELLYLGAGYDFSLNRDDSLRLRTMLGYKFVHVNASNGDIKFNRVPFDITLIKRFGSVALGGGLTYHLSPNYDGTVSGSSTRINFDDALGGTLQASYYFSQRMELGLRFTSIDYKSSSSLVLPNGSVTRTLSGNSAGIFFIAGF